MAQYHPEIFDVPDMKSAKEVILTTEGPGADTETRWEHETPYVLELMRAAVCLRSDMTVLDYGCGIGRMAKAMIDASGCSVIGVDISPSMRTLAPDYVGSDRFSVVSPDEFDEMTKSGLRVEAAISIWVLQHCFAPADDIARISRGLGPEGSAFILNMPKRAIPALDMSHAAQRFFWGTDGVDVATLLRAAFRVVAEGVPDKTRSPNMGDVGAYWMSLQNQEI